MKMIRWMVVGMAMLGAGAVFLLYANQNVYSKQNLRHMVQMPVAVNKVVSAGAPAENVHSLARRMLESQVSPEDFHRILRTGAAGMRTAEETSKIGSFVVQQLKNGNTGQPLAKALHNHLRSLGIPAGGWKQKGPPPIAKTFIPAFAQRRLGQQEEEGGPPAAIRNHLPGPAQNAGNRSDRDDRLEERRERIREEREEAAERAREALEEVDLPVSVKKLGQIAARVYQNPKRVDRILSKSNLSHSQFEQAVHTMISHPELARKYHQGFQSRMKDLDG